MLVNHPGFLARKANCMNGMTRVQHKVHVFVLPFGPWFFFCVKWLLWSRNALEKRAHLMRTAALGFAEAKLVALQMLNVFHGASCACSQCLPSTDGSGPR